MDNLREQHRANSTVDIFARNIMKSYCISDTTGFLFEDRQERLPSFYDEWTTLAVELAKLIESKCLRSTVHKMSVLSTEHLSNESELRLAHLVLALITAGYVWQDGEAGFSEVLPRQLAVPLWAVSERLGLPAIVCHADLVLYNFRKTDPDGPLALENLSLLYTTCGGSALSWFLLVTVQVELDCVPAIQSLLRCMKLMELGCRELVAKHLRDLSVFINRIQQTFRRMHEKLDGQAFYNSVRPFLNGWQTQGLTYEGVSDEKVKLYGGSAAQSTGIQAVDTFLGVQHESDKRSFLLEMRKYMPPAHRNFLTWLSEAADVRTYVNSHIDDLDLVDAFNCCIQELVALRSAHIQIVTKYIVIQAVRHKNNFHSLENQGTGGQSLLPFLKAVRGTTQEAAVRR